METKKLLSFFSGEASDDEKLEVIAWVNEDAANKEEFIKLKNAWSLSSHQAEVDDQQIEKAWQIFRSKIGRSIESGKTKMSSILKYAAILIIAFGAGVLGEKIFFHSERPKDRLEAMSVVEVPAGQSAQVTLPDSTNVYLNSGTKISYPSRFAQGKRTVRLEGEAFFDVSNNPALPFIVKTDKLDLRVLGTTFNVKAYEDLKMNVTLVEGSLGINSKRGKELVRLEPGENASYSEKEKKISIKKVDTQLYTSWRKGIVTFRNVALCEIVGEIERWYNVDIEIFSEELKNQSYSGTLLKSKPIDQVLEALSLTASFTYEIDYRDDSPSLIKLRKIRDK